ncbi:unnamed protein product [Amaranthus hypochondriacus]
MAFSPSTFIFPLSSLDFGFDCGADDAELPKAKRRWFYFSSCFLLLLILLFNGDDDEDDYEGDSAANQGLLLEAWLHFEICMLFWFVRIIIDLVKVL